METSIGDDCMSKLSRVIEASNILSRILAVELTPRHSKPEKGDHWIAKRSFIATKSKPQTALSLSKGNSVIVTNILIYITITPRTT